ncbi:hypothetical protein [Nocardioides daphniae]|uniref:TPM domain-containing protein n=1 Tax=Nocardioides daphniae TaxID=402297 RepID=A0A4P7UGF9_9ACTN|nr:hypothetical protein [Nocardioides daphniae]QCC78455.1 hypothetical protein E2C04_16895 [Nocardioides daphniae]GGD12273.1 hypothetical protein GCM10007231_09040 [Nocardioides daphniae]
MIRLLLMVLVIAAVVAVVYFYASRPAVSPVRLERVRRQVKAAKDLAYAHDEISPHLAGAIIARTRGLHEDDPVRTLEEAVEDVLALAREHRGEEPDLAVIVIDTLRRDDPQLG